MSGYNPDLSNGTDDPLVLAMRDASITPEESTPKAPSSSPTVQAVTDEAAAQAGMALLKMNKVD